MKNNKKLIFAVDDDKTILISITHLLKLNNYETVSTTDPHKAINLFNKFNDEIDLVLLDIMMPDIDGYTLSKQIREINKLVPIIFVTALEPKQIFYNIPKNYVLEVNDFITKPFEKEVLLPKIEILIKKYELEKQLDYTIKLLNNILNSQHDAIARSTTDGILTYCNQTYHNIFFKGEMCEGRSFINANHIHPDDKEYVLQHYQNYQNAPYKGELECRIKTSDGEYRWFHVQGSAILNVNNKIEEIQAVLRDIHNYKLILDQKKAILNSIPDLMFIFDKNGTYLDLHTTDDDLLIVPSNQVIGKNIKDIFNDDVLDDITKCFNKVFETKEMGIIEYKMNINSEDKYFQARINYMNENRLLSIVRDVTDLKKNLNFTNSSNSILLQISSGKKLNDILENICCHAELYDKNIKTSILLYNENDNKLYQGVGPSLPDEYNQLLVQGLPVGLDIGSCGTAAYTMKLAISEDIQKDHKWLPFKEYIDLTKKYNLNSCWSIPIISSSGNLLGTIANYSSEIGLPTKDNKEILEWCSSVSSIAIDNYNMIESEKQISHFRAINNNISGIMLESFNHDKTINGILSIVGNIINCSRTYIFEIKNKKELYYKYEWNNKNIEAQIDNLDINGKTFEELNLQEWYDTLNKKNYINGLVDDLPENYREILKLQNIKSILILPILLKDNELYGFIGFDECIIENRKWNNNEINFLEVLAYNIGSFMDRIKYEKRLEYKNNLFMSILNISELFLKNVNCDVIKDCLGIICELIGCSRAHYFDLYRKNSINEYEYISEKYYFYINKKLEKQYSCGAARFSEIEQDSIDFIDESNFKRSRSKLTTEIKFKRWIEKLNHENIINIDNIKILPINEREILEKYHIESILVLPVFLQDGTLRGVIGFDQCDYQRVWNNDEINILKLLSNNIGLFISRILADTEVRRTQHHQSILLDNLDFYIYYFKDPYTFGYMNKTYYDNIIGSKTKENRVKDYFDDDDAEQIIKTNIQVFESGEEYSYEKWFTPKSDKIPESRRSPTLVNIRKIPLKQNNKVHSILCIAYDVTDLHYQNKEKYSKLKEKMDQDYKLIEDTINKNPSNDEINKLKEYFNNENNLLTNSISIN